MKTPQQPYPALSQALGVPELYLKREDLHKYGSHKGRSIPHMIKHYAKEGWRNFVISSSGNAALAAIRAVDQHNKNNPDSNISLRVLVGKHIDPIKYNNLQSPTCLPDRQVSNLDSIFIEQVERPKQQAFILDKEGKAKYLRQSTDDLALEGYIELATELSKIPNLSAVFIPTSSGTTALALAEAFAAQNPAPQVHVVQTTACHPIAEAFDSNFTHTHTSLAGAIVDNVAHRKTRVVDAIKKTGGFGWIISDDEIKDAMELVKQTAGITISPNSALAIAGIKKAAERGWKWEGAIAAIITGS